MKQNEAKSAKNDKNLVKQFRILNINMSATSKPSSQVQRPFLPSIHNSFKTTEFPTKTKQKKNL